jgi:DNA-binding response OmpR family regulator
MHEFPILIVDDDLESQKLYANILENAGYEVFTAANGAMAMAILAHVSFPLIIANSEIPELDGFELCRRIRARETPEYTYIILYSSRGSQTDIAAGLAAGADQYLTAPIDQREMLASLNAAQRILNMLRFFLKKKQSWNPLSMTHILPAPSTGSLRINSCPCRSIDPTRGIYSAKSAE